MIRPATSADRTAIRDLHLASWRDSYGAELSADYLRDTLPAAMDEKWSARTFGAPELTLVAYTDTEMTGFACALTDRDPPLIDNLHVRPELRGGGTVALREAGFVRAYLTVLESNPRALAFYLAQGGVDEGPVDDIMVGHVVKARRMGFDLCS